MGIAGHLSIVLADVVVAVLCGAAVLAATCGTMLPLVAYTISGTTHALAHHEGSSSVLYLKVPIVTAHQH